MSAYATNHSLERAKERRSFNQKAAKRDIKKAFKYGKRAEDFTSWERQYLLKARDGCFAVAYNGFCYLFNNQDGGCLTLYRLPSWFGKKKRPVDKEQLREYRRSKLSLDEQDWSLEDVLSDATQRSFASQGESGKRQEERELD